MPNTPTTEKTAKSPLKTLLMSTLDRVMFIGIGALGAVATTYFTGMIKLNPPELIAEVSYNSVDKTKEVAKEVGALKLDYQEEIIPYSIMRVDIKNDGRGPAENVRFQVKLPETTKVDLYAAPDLKVYSPTQFTFEKNELYTELAHFPSGAHDYVALKVDGQSPATDSVRVKLVNNEYEGAVVVKR